MKPCGSPKCCSSTGICDTTTHGHGLLSENGYWQHPCFVCARHYEGVFKEPQWPHPGEKTDPLASEIEKRECRGCGNEFECFKNDSVYCRCDNCEKNEECCEFDLVEQG